MYVGNLPAHRSTCQRPTDIKDGLLRKTPSRGRGISVVLLKPGRLLRSLDVSSRIGAGQEQGVVGQTEDSIGPVETPTVEVSTPTVAMTVSTPPPPSTWQQLAGMLTQPIQAVGNAIQGAREYQPPPAPNPRAQVELLPEKNFGVLRGGQYPFTFDPVYGLPVVREVAKYGEVLRDIREGRVEQVLWFFDPATVDPFFMDGRCIIRYKDGGVKQSVIPPHDYRIPYAMEAQGVRGVKIPLEPRHVVEYGPWDDGQTGLLERWLTENVAYQEPLDPAARRGPRIGPSMNESIITDPQDVKDQFLDRKIEFVKFLMSDMERLGSEEYESYLNAQKQRMTPEEEARLDRTAYQAVETQKWTDRVTLSQDTQALIYKYVPIVGPILGSAFVVGLYMLARLLRGDLTDRMKMMNLEEDKQKRTALKEIRIAFLEEEVPAMVAKGATLEVVQRKALDVNKKLGEKLEISEVEVESTYSACKSLLEEGQELTTDTDASGRLIAEQEAKEKQDSQEGGEMSDMDALMEMGKLNTARIRKAIDPRIIDVKKRVRAARRSMKRESKVQLTDEIVFFDDVAGNEQAKVELMEVVDFFRQPEKFRKSGAKAPKGVLLVGPPGNGKTLMARAVAGESGVAFISSSASEFIEMYMGLGAARVRDLFNTARKLAPCVIFIDELDAVGRARRTGGQGNDERDNTVNQLLTEMDGFEAEQSGIVVMGATNRKDVLDSALTRPGRFDRSIEVRRPNFEGRLEAIKIHMRDRPISADLDYVELARLTGGMSGAQLAGVCNTACFLASREGRADVDQEDIVKAIEVSKYGRSYDAHRFISPARRRRFAVMEAGISLAATLYPAIEPVDYVTILPSVKSPLGRTVLQPNVGRATTGVWTRRYLEQQLRVALAGRAAEEIFFGYDELSSLNQHRLQFARQIVHRMLNAGFSNHPDFENIRTLGHNYYDPSFEPGRWQLTTIQTDTTQSRSEWIDTDMEMEYMLNTAYEEVKGLLMRNHLCLERLVNVLVDKERITGDEVRELVEAYAEPEDLERRAEAKQVALL